MTSHFSEGYYRSAPETRRTLLNRLTMGWRWAFYLDYGGEVLRARGMAVHGKYDDAAWAESSFRVMRIIERNRGRFDIRGIDNLRRIAVGAPYVFISNHMSTLETQILPTLIVPFMPVTFVVKRQLVENPIFGPIMRSRDPVVVGRENAREDLAEVLTRGKELLSAGVSVVVFPQSTRTPEFERDQVNTLGIKLASHARVQAVPIAVKTDFWGEQGLFRGFGPVRPERTIYMEFGMPVSIEGRGREQHEAILDFIRSRQEQWRRKMVQ